MLRVLGMISLSFGVLMLIMCAPVLIQAAQARSLAGIIMALVCTGVVPSVMVVIGIAIIRRAEDKTVHQIERARPMADTSQDLVQGIFAHAGRLDLNRLNWIGWLLLLATFGFVVAEVVIVTLLMGERAWDGPLDRRLLGLGGVLLSIGFFAGIRWLLRALGVSIYRC
jgi:hypothetical protein